MNNQNVQSVTRPSVKTNEDIVGKVESSAKQQSTNSIFGFLSMSKKELQSKYKIQYLGTGKIDGANHWHLRLTPKGKDKIKVAELFVDKDGITRL